MSTLDPAASAEAEAPPAQGRHRYDFNGYRPYLEAAAARYGLPPRIVPDIAQSVPIRHAGRVLAGLAVLSRDRPRPLWPNELASVEAALLGLVETDWHFRVASAASLAMIQDTRRALIPAPGDPEPGDPAPDGRYAFEGVGPYVEAQARLLGLPDKFVRRARQCPESHRIAARCGDLFMRFSPAGGGPADLRPDDRAVVVAALANAAQDAAILTALADATQSMLAEAFAGFGLEMPDDPPADMPECRGVDPFLTTTKRNRGKPVLAYFA